MKGSFTIITTVLDAELMSCNDNPEISSFNELPDLPDCVHHVVVEVTNGPHTLRK